MTINNTTPKATLEAVQLGDTLSYHAEGIGGFTGKVFNMFKGINCGKMSYSFYIQVEGDPFTHYIFESREIN